MAYHLGVDVGTTYTAAAIGRAGRVEPATLGTRSVSVPSVVCMSGDRLLIGEPAARRAVTDPRRVAREFKRRVGDPTPLLLAGAPISAELCMARVVEWAVAQVAATEGEPPASLALTHPANWGEYKLDLLRQALRHVDLTADHLVPEPVAAATAYAAQRPLDQGTVVAVYDLGGGTFDVALVRASGQAGGAGLDAEIVGRPDGIERLGGIDFDHAVFRHVLDAIGIDPDRLDPDDPTVASGLAQLREECVEAKEGLSHETDVSIPVMLPQRHTEVRLLRREFEAMIRPALDETLVALRRAVASAGMAVDDVAAVLLVGGSSRIPLVAEIVGAELGRPVAVDARPKDTIPLGAALVAMSAAGVAGVPVPPAAELAGVAAPPAAGPVGAAPPLPGPARPAAPPPAGAAGVAVPAGAAPQGPPPAGVGPAATGARRPPPPPPPSSSRRGRGPLVAAVVAVAVLAAVAGVIALSGGGGDDDDDGGTAGSVPATVAPAGGTGTSDGGVDATLPGIDVGATGDLPTPAPLPGDDWSDAARTQFVTDCTSGIASQMASVGADPQTLCGCVYDDVSTSSDFADFNEQWASPDFDPSSPVGQDLTGALFACAPAAAGG